MPSEQMDNEIDNIILGIVHQAGLIPRGKTISAAMFPEARAAIERMVEEAVINELETIVKKSAAHGYAACAADTDYRIAELKRLTTPTEDKQND
jgi:hypothetical protein